MAHARDLARHLVGIRAAERRTEFAIAHTTDPVKLAALEARLTELQANEKRTVAELEAAKREGKRLIAEARRLKRQAEALEAQKAGLEAQAAALQQQAATLQQEGDALQAQADSLQQQADALKQQKAELDALQAKAAKQQKQAEQLQDELTKELTKAGGDYRGTDPRHRQAAGRADQHQGRRAGRATAGLQARQRRRDQRDRDDGAVGGGDRRPREAPARQGDPEQLGEGADRLVGGSTAANVDLAAEIANRLPLVIATILLLCMLVLLVAFRSILIPLQAAITNFLTAMAAFGILTAVFQWGWGIDLVGIDTTASTVPIASFVPLMMFAVLFGLSMDYQVFLLSSVDHYRAEGESDRESVRLGLKASARVIAAAALIMMSVFSSFILNGDPVVKQFGVGLASAVFLAAAMVLMLAPAVLTVMGKWAWWMPSVLGKVIPVVDIEGTNLGAPKTTPPPEPAPPDA